MNSPRLSRRNVMRSAGVALALPTLDVDGNESQAGATRPRRLMAVCNNLGLLSQHFFPKQSGPDYELSTYLQHLAEVRDHVTVLSGVSHPGVDGSHASDVSFLTAAPHPASGGFRNTISLDQLIASQWGHLTRFPSLTLGVNAKQGRRSLSWTNAGALIPCEDKASQVYKRLFLRGSERQVELQMLRLRMGRSIMDTVGEQSRSLSRRLGNRDRERLDQYFEAVRDVEKRLLQTEQWAQRPKPEAPVEMPLDPSQPSQFMEKSRLMYQMARLAFQTDSTRCITLLLDCNNSPTIDVQDVDITDGYHNLSHHGNNASKLSQLEAIDSWHMRLLGEFLRELQATGDGDSNLLRETTVIYGSNLGDANKHTTTNMPVLVAGGHFRHGQHLAFDRQQNYPLPNLFVSILQQMGLEEDRFASSTGTMRGLEISS